MMSKEVIREASTQHIYLDKSNITSCKSNLDLAEFFEKIKKKMGKQVAIFPIELILNLRHFGWGYTAFSSLLGSMIWWPHRTRTKGYLKMRNSDIFLNLSMIYNWLFETPKCLVPEINIRFGTMFFEHF